MKKILVTGPNGYIAKAFIDEYGSDYNFRLFGRSYAGDRHEFINGDIRNLDELVRATEGIDVIIHLAAATTDGSDITNYDYFHVNTVGTFNVLEAAIQNQVGKIVYASSVCAAGFRATPERIMESNRCVPSDGMYGYSKYLSEKLCECYAQEHDIDIICLRNAMVVPQHEFVVPTNPFSGHWLGVVHIEDVLEAYRLAVENKAIHYGVFHVAPDNPFSKFDISLAKKELGFKPKHNFEEIKGSNTAACKGIGSKIVSKIRNILR